MVTKEQQVKTAIRARTDAQIAEHCAEFKWAMGILNQYKPTGVENGTKTRK